MANCHHLQSNGRFPSVCYDHILSFLPISDCLHFATASTTTLAETLRTVKERRNRFAQPVTVAKSKLKHGESCLIIEYESASQNMFDIPLVTTSNGSDIAANEGYITVLPCAQDRVGQLVRQMPRKCKLFQQVQQLHACFDEGQEVGCAVVTRSSLVDVLQRDILPMRLLSGILRDSLFAEENQGLHSYIGQVMCLAFLYDNLEISRDVYRRARQRVKDLPASSTDYNYWVRTHASLIRRCMFSEERRRDLRMNDMPNASLEALPHFPSIVAAYQALTWLPQLEEETRPNNDDNAVLTLIYDEFAPLGPQFRGRDIVQIRDVTASSMAAGATAALDWIQVAHEQATKTYPMTVRPPEIRF